MPAWVSYSILRVLAFAVPFTILMLLQIPMWLSAILAAIIGLCVSYIFLRPQREAVSHEIYAARHDEVHRTDDETEDAIVDGAVSYAPFNGVATATATADAEAHTEPHEASTADDVVQDAASAASETPKS